MYCQSKDVVEFNMLQGKLEPPPRPKDGAESTECFPTFGYPAVPYLMLFVKKYDLSEHTVEIMVNVKN